MSCPVYQSMICLSFPFAVCHRCMTSEYGAQFQSLQIETCIPKLIVKTTIKQEGIFELTSGTFVGHGNLSIANSQGTIVRMSVGDCVQNQYIESIVVLQRYTIAAWEEVILARAWCTMTGMETIVEMIHLPLKGRLVEGLSVSGMDQSWQFPYPTNNESGWSSPHSWQRDTQSSDN